MQAASSVDISTSNVLQLLYYAIMHNVGYLKQRAVRFLLKNMEAITKADEKGKRAWHQMIKMPEMLLELFYAISETTAPTRETVPERDTQMDELWKMSNGLRQMYAYPDVIIVTKDQTKLYAHLSLLMLSAPKFAHMLNEQRDSNDHVNISDFDGDVVEEFLRGVYRQQPSLKFPQVSPV